MTTPCTIRILSGIAALVVAALFTGCPGKDDVKGKGGALGPVPVQTALAARKDIPVDLRAIGTVEPIANISIQAQVGGELIGIHFEEGQEVKKGDLLFTIQPRLYATRLAQEEANLARDKATATNARVALQRQEELDRKGAGIKEELDRARAASEAADAAVKADEALVLIAQTQLGYSTIESPLDGRTGATRVRPGALIRLTDDTPMTTVVQMAPIYVSFALPEQHLDAIRAGMAKGKLRVSALEPRTGRKLADGTLAFIANMVDVSTGTIMLKASFPNEDRALWPGAFADAVLHLDTEKSTVVVPASAVSLGQRGAQVWVVKADGSAELHTVKTGRTVAQDTVVLEGVAEGEKVVSTGQSRLLPGAKVIEKKPADGAVAKAEEPPKGAKE
jgi:multidrug efflux system membrane fusion protein